MRKTIMVNEERKNSRERVRLEDTKGEKRGKKN